MDDFSGQVDAAVRKPLPRLVRVVNRAIHAVAEPEFSREVDREPAGLVNEVVVLDLLDEGAVVVLDQHAGYGVFEVEAFSKDQ